MTVGVHFTDSTSDCDAVVYNREELASRDEWKMCPSDVSWWISSPSLHITTDMMMFAIIKIYRRDER